MKSLARHIIFLFVVLPIFIGCTGMNDIQDKYLSNGERVYIGKVDTIAAFTGDGRVELRFWDPDFRAKKIQFSWIPNNDTLIVNIHHFSAKDSFEVFIGGPTSTKTIEEGNYTVKSIAYDSLGNSSIPFEKVINIYGDRYRSTLTNRIISSALYKQNSLKITFSAAISKDDIGVKISYTDNNGISKDSVFSYDKILVPVILPDVDPTKLVLYRTMYIPEPTAIDTFYTQSAIIPVKL